MLTSGRQGAELHTSDKAAQASVSPVPRTMVSQQTRDATSNWDRSNYRHLVMWATMTCSEEQHIRCAISKKEFTHREAVHFRAIVAITEGHSCSFSNMENTEIF